MHGHGDERRVVLVAVHDVVHQHNRQLKPVHVRIVNEQHTRRRTYGTRLCAASLSVLAIWYRSSERSALSSVSVVSSSRKGFVMESTTMSRTGGECSGEATRAAACVMRH